MYIIGELAEALFKMNFVILNLKHLHASQVYKFILRTWTNYVVIFYCQHNIIFDLESITTFYFILVSTCVYFIIFIFYYKQLVQLLLYSSIYDLLLFKNSHLV